MATLSQVNINISMI